MLQSNKVTDKACTYKCTDLDILVVALLHADVVRDHLGDGVALLLGLGAAHLGGDLHAVVVAVGVVLAAHANLLFLCLANLSVHQPVKKHFHK